MVYLETFQHTGPLITAQDVCVSYKQRRSVFVLNLENQSQQKAFQKGGHGGRREVYCIMGDIYIALKDYSMIGVHHAFFCPQHVLSDIGATQPTCS